MSMSANSLDAAITPGQSRRKHAVLAVGRAASDLCAPSLAPRSDVEWRDVADDEQALFMCCDMTFDCVVIAADETADKESLEERISTLSQFDTVTRLIVVASDVALVRAWNITSIDHVVATDIAAAELVPIALGGAAHHDDEYGNPAPAEESSEAESSRSATAKPPSFRLKPVLTPLLATLYKNGALVCLTGLFALFVSYGVLICFFILSTAWSAPTELNSGHELVIRTSQKLGELGVKSNQVQQRIGEAHEDAREAQRAHDDARSLIRIVDRTLDVEASQLETLRDDLTSLVKQFAAVKAEFETVTGKQGAARAFENAFEERLVNRESYNASQISLLEAAHRLVVVEGELARRRLELRKTKARLDMLASLKTELASTTINHVRAADVEMVPLAEQVLDVKTKFATAHSNLESIRARVKLLKRSLAIITTSIAELAASPLGRAASKPIHVLFVPYENLKSFAPGEPVFDCLLLIIICQNVGQTGDAILGEATAVHPFFGKPVRGQFVNVQLRAPQAARKGWLHGGRPPLFF